MARAREWSDYVAGQVETPFGPMEFALTQGSHVSISAGGSPARVPAITVNRVPYHAHFHFHLQPDGSWGTRDPRDQYMTRSGTGDYASSAAMKKAVEGVRSAWEEFISHQPDLMAEAEASHLNREIKNVEEEIEKAQAALDELVAKRRELLKAEEEIIGPDPKRWSPRDR